MTRIIELLNQAREERESEAAPLPAAAPAPAMALEAQPIVRPKPVPPRERPAVAPLPPPPATPSASRSRAQAQVPPAMQAEVAQLFARLHPLLDEQGSLVLHVAAAQAGEGTSTIARALAAHVASLRRYRTLLIDAATLPGRPGAPPKARSLTGAGRAGLDPAELVAESESEWLGTAALAGTDADGEPSVAEVATLYDRLRERWPVIIVDAPPILEHAEMVNLARKSDGVLLVVRAAQPNHEHLVRARDLVDGSGARILGLILNRYESAIPGFIERRI